LFVAILGYINEERLRELLTTMGERFTDDEVYCYEISMKGNNVSIYAVEIKIVYNRAVY